jgi:hypothetical protein
MPRSLDEVRVAAPCGVSWDDMIGTNRVRYCHHCRLNVYNLSAMSRADAETLIQGREGQLCVRFYRRADGTMIAQDCPVGRQAGRWALHRGWVLLTASLASVLAVFFGVSVVASSGRSQPVRKIVPFSGLLQMFSPSPEILDAHPAPPRSAPAAEEPVCVLGEITVVDGPIEPEDVSPGVVTVGASTESKPEAVRQN